MQQVAARRPRRRLRSGQSVLYWMALPGMLFFLIFNYLPMLGVIIAFKNYNFRDGIFGSPWSGFANFEFFFTSPDLFRVTYNTLFLNVLFIGSGTIASVGTAILLNEIRSKVSGRIFQTFIFFPYFISWIVVSLFLGTFLATDRGIIDNLLVHFGFDRVDFMNSPGLWPAILVLVYLWKSTGYGVVVYLAAITGINPEYYEAARIDGANRFQQITRILLPQLRPTILVMLILAVGRIFYGDFGMIYALVGDNGQLYSTTDVIDTYVFRSMRTLGDMGMTSAVGLYQSLMGLIMIVAANWVSRKMNDENKGVLY
ncbi:ABC transporter permease subunit [Paenibacillus sp. ATY16]|uniref:ABC transporter permease n=1 Tax=Paenibacillus sp. ATY16 TaxID=1759312 RepID=UPI00200F60B2|nr:ABC transporter permease subunit [Paenibacillus sp. ATY16]MCK9858651.1 ABC transporter permease subunit [Paenibacillus sp. ATY16]